MSATLEKGYLKAADLAHLAKLSRLRGLVITAGMADAKGGVVSDDLSCFKGLKNLRRLVLRPHAQTERSALRSLSHLSMREKDFALELVSALPDMRKLRLARNHAPVVPFDEWPKVGY